MPQAVEYQTISDTQLHLILLVTRFTGQLPLMYQPTLLSLRQLEDYCPTWLTREQEHSQFHSQTHSTSVTWLSATPNSLSNSPLANKDTILHFTTQILQLDTSKGNIINNLFTIYFRFFNSKFDITHLNIMPTDGNNGFFTLYTTKNLSKWIDVILHINL